MIGGAEVKAEKGKLETGRRKVEKEEFAIREPSQVHRNKEARERRPSDKVGAREPVPPFLQSPHEAVRGKGALVDQGALAVRDRRH